MAASIVIFLNSTIIAASEPKDADIIWTSMQVDEEMRKAVGLNEQQFINQFPFEACLVMKHHLAETIQKVTASLSFSKTKGVQVKMCLLLLNSSLFFSRLMDLLNGFSLLIILRQSLLNSLAIIASVKGKD